jgi:guanylate kinase
MPRGVLFIVSSPSGGGKTTLIKETMLRLEAVGIPARFSVSHTTRAPRPATGDPRRAGEVDGVDYHFVSDETFKAMIHADAFLEYAEYAGNRYGTSRAEVEQHLAAGRDVFLDIEVQGANQVKSKIRDAVKIFVYPPSYEVLKQRLTSRRQDSDTAIRERLGWALREFDVSGEFDYAIINDRLEQAVDALAGICIAEHQKLERMKPRLDAIRDAFRAALEEDLTT